MGNKKERPLTLREFERMFPEVWKSYEGLRDACEREGGLDPKTRELIKIGIETSCRRRGGLLAHVHKAKSKGAETKEIFQSILLALPLIGLPLVLDAFLIVKKALKD